jgi:hypothetical protein
MQVFHFKASLDKGLLKKRMNWREKQRLGIVRGTRGISLIASTKGANARMSNVYAGVSSFLLHLYLICCLSKKTPEAEVRA